MANDEQLERFQLEGTIFERPTVYPLRHPTKCPTCDARAVDGRYCDDCQKANDEYDTEMWLLCNSDEARAEDERLEYERRRHD